MEPQYHQYEFDLRLAYLTHVDATGERLWQGADGALIDYSCFDSCQPFVSSAGGRLSYKKGEGTPTPAQQSAGRSSQRCAAAWSMAYPGRSSASGCCQARCPVRPAALRFPGTAVWRATSSPVSMNRFENPEAPQLIRHEDVVRAAEHQRVDLPGRGAEGAAGVGIALRTARRSPSPCQQGRRAAAPRCARWRGPARRRGWTTKRA